MPTSHAPPPSVVLRNGPMSATVFLPGKDAYYRSSRFDHGSMVGDLKLGQTTVFASNFWKSGSGLEQRPHDPEDPEAPSPYSPPKPHSDALAPLRCPSPSPSP